MYNRWRAAQVLFLNKSIIWPLVIFIYIVSCYWRLGSFLPGASSSEISSIRLSSSLHSIGKEVANVPYYLVQHIFLKLHLAPITSARLTSAIFMGLFVWGVYTVLRLWLGRPVAGFGAMFFATNPYALVLARTGTPRVTMFYLILIAAAFSWCLQNGRQLVFWWLLTVSVGLALYIPGLIWPIVAAAIYLRREILGLVRPLSRPQLYWSVGLLLIISTGPIYAAFANLASLRHILLLPDHWPNLANLVRFLGWSLSSLFIKAPSHTAYILGRTPILSGAEAVLMVLGIYALYRRMPRVIYLLAAVALPCWLLAAVNQTTGPLYFLLPFFVALAAVGARFLYLEWRRIFPLNPLAKVVALLLISAVLAVHVIYGLRYSLVAWPNNPDIRAVYMIK